MIPIRDRNPTVRRPYVTYVLIALNLAAFFLWQPLGDANEPSSVLAGERFLTRGELFAFCHGAIPLEVLGLRPLPELVAACDGKSVPISILTSMFLHGGLLHLGGNLLYLWVFGNNVEDRMGRGVFLAFYVLAGVAAVYAQAFSSPGSIIPMIGAVSYTHLTLPTICSV